MNHCFGITEAVLLFAIGVVPRIHVVAQNETYGPTFPADCEVSIKEGSVSRPTFITNCSALAGNKTDTFLNYTLLAGNVNNTFSIDDNGTVYQTGEVDREKKSFYFIQILVTDSYGRNDSTYLNITVHDLNDNSPEVYERNFIRNITANDLEMRKTSFYQVRALDRDSGKNGQLKYTMRYIVYDSYAKLSDHAEKDYLHPCANRSLPHAKGPLRDFCVNRSIYYDVGHIMKLCSNHSMHHDNETLLLLCASYYLHLERGPFQEVCSNQSLHRGNRPLLELCATYFLHQNKTPLFELCGNNSQQLPSGPLQMLCTNYSLLLIQGPLMQLCANNSLQSSNVPLQELCAANNTSNPFQRPLVQLCSNDSLRRDNSPLQALCANPFLNQDIKVPNSEACGPPSVHQGPRPPPCAVPSFFHDNSNMTGPCISLSINKGYILVPCGNNSLDSANTSIAEFCTNHSLSHGKGVFHKVLCHNYSLYSNNTNFTKPGAGHFDRDKFDDLFFGYDREYGEDRFFEFINYDGVNGYGDRVMFQINVTDMGNPQRSTMVTGMFLLGGPCPVQNHTINSTTGLITSLLLCEVQLEPSTVSPRPGESVSLTCNYLSNINHTKVLFQHVSGYTRVRDTPTLNITNVTRADSGTYTCRIVTDIGELSSYNEFIDVTEGIYLPATFGVHTLRESDTARLICVYYSIVIPYGLQWFKREFGELGREKLITNTTARVSFSPGILIIEDLQLDDAGQYSCTDGERNMPIAENVLLVYREEQVVNVEVTGYSNPSTSDSCHDINQQEFESELKNLTGLQARIITQEGSNICNNGSCSSSPCLNYGYCVNADNETDGFKCVCPPGLTGKLCEENVNECLIPGICNNGTCRDVYGSYYCSCRPGYVGYSCQFSDSCRTNTCPKEHTCVNSVFEANGYYCYDNVWSDLSQLLQVTVFCALYPNSTCKLDQYYLDRLDDLVKFIRDRFNSTIFMADMDKNGTNCNELGQCDDVYNLSGCEAKFIMHPTKEPQNSTVSLPLVWNCPEGNITLPKNLLDNICKDLFKHQKVIGCSSPSGLFYYQGQSGVQLPNASFTFSMIVVDDNMTILESNQVIEILNNDTVQSMLRTFGFNVGNVYSRSNPNDTTQSTVSITQGISTTLENILNTEAARAEDEDSSVRGTVIGAVISVFVVFAILSILVIAIVTIFAYHKSVKRFKKMAYLSEAGIGGPTHPYQQPTRLEQQQRQPLQPLPPQEVISGQMQEHIQHLQQQKQAQQQKAKPPVQQPKELAPNMEKSEYHQIEKPVQHSTGRRMDKAEKQPVKEPLGVWADINEEIPEKLDNEPAEVDDEIETVDTELDAEPENLDAEPENLDVEPENLDAEPENLDAKPENLDAEPENLDAEPENLDAEPKKLDNEPEKLNIEPDKQDSEPEMHSNKSDEVAESQKKSLEDILDPHVNEQEVDCDFKEQILEEEVYNPDQHQDEQENQDMQEHQDEKEHHDKQEHQDDQDKLEQSKPQDDGSKYLEEETF